MAEITLADYAGYIFREMIRAREMADAYSRHVAEQYARDPVLRHFSVPRFKVPTMQLTIPVLISGARFAETVRFIMAREAFLRFVIGEAAEVVAAVRQTQGRPFVVRPLPVILNPNVARPANAPGNALVNLGGEFWDLLVANPDPTKPNSIVQQMWPQIFERALQENDLFEHYKKIDPKNERLVESMTDVIKIIRTNTVVDSSDIKSLLVNPETQVVKDGSSDASVFVIKVDMTEEGFYIRSVKDEETRQVRPVVEFE